MRSEVAAPMHTARAVLFSFLFGLRSAAGGLRDVREPLLLSRERACDRALKNKIKWENRKHERSRSRLAFLKTEPAHWACAILSSGGYDSASAPLTPRGVGTVSVARPTRSVTFSLGRRIYRARCSLSNCVCRFWV